MDRSLRMLGVIACGGIAAVAIHETGIHVALVPALLAFTALFWIATSATAPGWRRIALGAQAAIAIAVAAAGLMPRLEGALLAVVVAQTATIAPLAISIACSVAACIATFVLVSPHGQAAALRAMGELAIFAAFANVAFMLRARERAARAELARIHGQLMAAQSLLLDGARSAERLHIARELHDSIGHDLVALILTLEVATRDSSRVQAALAQAKRLLAHVREIVGEIRPDAAIDLAAALHALVGGLVAPPHVVLEVAEELAVEDVGVAHAAFRCAQELLTNALKHARATRIDLAAAIAGDRLRIVVRDDGVARGAPTEGLGLLGVRERLAGVGGALTIESGRGLVARIEVPL